MTAVRARGSTSLDSGCDSGEFTCVLVRASVALRVVGPTCHHDTRPGIYKATELVKIIGMAVLAIAGQAHAVLLRVLSLGQGRQRLYE